MTGKKKQRDGKVGHRRLKQIEGIKVQGGECLRCSFAPGLRLRKFSSFHERKPYR